MYCFIVIVARSPKWRYRQGWFLCWPVRKGTIVGLTPWLIDAIISLLFLHTIFSLSMSLLEFIFYEETSHIGLEFTLMISFYLCKEPFPNKFTFILGARASAYGFGKEYNTTHDPDVSKIEFKSHEATKYTILFSTLWSWL